MSTGSLLGGVLGAVGGFFIGGPAGALYGAQIGFGLGMLVDPITPDVPIAGRLQVGELNITTAKEGICIAEILGSPKLTGNIIGYWNSRSEEVEEEVSGGKGGGGSQTVTAGYRFYLTWLMGLCMGPINTVYSIYQNDKCIWEGELERPESGGEETIVIPDFGSVTIYFGTDDQTVNSTLAGLVNDPTLLPAYRHLCCVFFDDCFIGEQNRLPIMRFVIKKNPSYDFSTNSRETINTYDHNPAHSIYHILTNLVDLPVSFLGDNSFDLACENLYCEGNGITMLMDKQAEAIQYLEQIIYHIGGIIRFNNDATLNLKLLRKDVLVENLPIVDESMMLDDLIFGRDSWINTFNDVKVQFPLRYFETEVGGVATEGDGLGDCEATPVLNYIGCIEESYYFNSQAGEYTITSGCGPFTLYYKDENMTAYRKVKDIYGRGFTYLCRSIVCAGNGEDRYIKVLDRGNDLWSNVLNIAVTEAPLFGLTAELFEVNSGESALITLAGGKPPYNWRITGTNIYFDSEKTKQEINTILTSVTIYADGSEGGSVILNVSDACISLDSGSIEIAGCCDNLPYGSFEFDDDSTPDTINPGSSINVYVSGGCPPFTWSVVETGYSFSTSETEGRENVLNCASGTCGPAGDYTAIATITITDKCGVSVVSKIRNTSGDWSTTTWECLGEVNASDQFAYNIVGDKRYVVRYGDDNFGTNLCRTVSGAGNCSDYNYRCSEYYSDPNYSFAWPTIVGGVSYIGDCVPCTEIGISPADGKEFTYQGVGYQTWEC